MTRGIRISLAGVVFSLAAATSTVCIAGHSPDEHAAHRAAMSAPHYAVTSGRYDVPDVVLLDQSAAQVSLRSLLDSEEPIALNFIFTTCTTICPVMTATFAQMQRELGPEAAGIRLVSISIDPDYDRPGILDEYASKFGAGSNWLFLTGDGNDVTNVLRSFDAYAGSKLNHRAVTLLRRPGSDAWVRIDGLTSGSSLAKEVRTHLLD